MMLLPMAPLITSIIFQAVLIFNDIMCISLLIIETLALSIITHDMLYLSVEIAIGDEIHRLEDDVQVH
jgi:hypothetical protein